MGKGGHIPGFSLELLKAGDKSAFELLHRLYYQALCFFSEQITKDQSAAREIVQEVFLELWERKKNTAAIRNINAYLYAATRNRSINYMEVLMRKHKREKELTDIMPVSEEETLRHIIRAEVLREISLAIEQLPDQCRKIIKFIYEEGMTPDEIAGRMGISVSTVRNQKARGLGLLRKLLSDGAFVLLTACL